MKTHFCHISEGYPDSEPEYVGKSLCGLRDYELGSNDFNEVDCKSCLKARFKSDCKVLRKIMHNFGKSHEEGGNCPTLTS